MTEKLSIWMDSELAIEEARLLPPQLKCDANLRGKWDRYHVIGDALRGVWGPDLSVQIFASLDAEAMVIVPRRQRAAVWLNSRPLQMVASIAIVAVIGAIWATSPALHPDRPQIAAIPKPEVPKAGVPAGDGAKDYLLAHQRYSPSNSLHGVAAYLPALAEVQRADFRMPAIDQGASISRRQLRNYSM